MTRPSPHTSYLGNYVGDVPTMTHPLNRPIGPPMAVAPLGPYLIAEPGYVPAPGWGRFYYAADDGVWRDTETGEVYPGLARALPSPNGETP